MFWITVCSTASCSSSALPPWCCKSCSSNTVLTVSLRTLERACESYCQALAAEDKATVRFETPPREQLQIDFGSRQITIGNEATKIYLFVTTLGYPRRHYAHSFRHERQLV